MSIRGNFRNTVEYIIKLLEAQAFIDNSVTTSWLDKLISSNIETEKPDYVLAAICGAVSKAVSWYDKNLADSLSAIEKGQTPQLSTLQTETRIDFIYDNVQYILRVSFCGVETLAVTINGVINEISFKKMTDGGLLVLVGGTTHSVYTNEKPHATTLTLDSRTCVLEKDRDPSKLLSPSPGKLVRYLVEDGTHVSSGEAFAEIEVMKMYMPLLATETGIIRLSVPSGSVLSTGDLIGTLILDDPSKVKKVTCFSGSIPNFGYFLYNQDLQKLLVKNVISNIIM